MTRKDSERDAERPHYYSQFWLDVAAGRRVIGAPKTEEGVEGSEPEASEAATLRKSGRNSMPAVTDGYKEAYPRTVIEPMLEPEEMAESEFEDELASNVDEMDIPNIVVDEPEAQAPDMDLAPVEAEEVLYDEEEEEEDDWNVGRGRKKAKPGRQTKQPKKPKRDHRARGH